MINLWGTLAGIGIQNNTQYFRTYKNFAWYKGGSYDPEELHPGNDGTVQMVIKDGNVGIGEADPKQKLTVNGEAKAKSLDVDGTVKAGKFQGDGSGLTGLVKESGGNMTGALTIPGLTVNGTASITGNVGVGKGVSDVRLDVNGTVKAGKFQGDGSGLTGLVKESGGTMTGALTITAPKEESLALAISGNHYLEFGAGVTKKEANAGKIGYKTFTGGLDIVGAGEKEDLSDREITLHAQGGVKVYGPILTMNGFPILMDGFLGKYDSQKKEAKNETMQAKVKAILATHPVGTFLLYLTTGSPLDDPWIAWKNKDDKVVSAPLSRSGGPTPL